MSTISKKLCKQVMERMRDTSVAMIVQENILQEQGNGIFQLFWFEEGILMTLDYPNDTASVLMRKCVAGEIYRETMKKYNPSMES